MIDNKLTLMGISACAAAIFLGAAYAISSIARSAMVAMSRQPEIADKISASISQPTGLIEAATLLSLVVVSGIAYLAK